MNELPSITLELESFDSREFAAISEVRRASHPFKIHGIETPVPKRQLHATELQRL